MNFTTKILVGALVLFFVPLAVVQAPTTTSPIRPMVLTKGYLVAYAEEVAVQHHLDPTKFVSTINLETGGTWNTTIQSKDINPATGQREQSFGLVQINLPSHPTITKAQAEDYVFALNWAADEWEHGRATEWSGYRILASMGWPKSYDPLS